MIMDEIFVDEIFMDTPAVHVHPGAGTGAVGPDLIKQFAFSGGTMRIY